MTPLVTVVVPIYNVEKYLDRCLNSITNQTYKNLQIILVDDGSPDSCPQMCDDWALKDKRVKVIHKENAGLGMARNSGLEIATGEYIFFFDSDDYIDHTLVEKCVNKAQQHSCDVVVFGRVDVSDEGVVKDKPLTNNKSLFKGNTVQNEFLPSMFTYDMGFGVSVWGKMYRLDVFKRYELKFISEREIISEDAYFALELYSKDITVGIVNENLYFYYVRSDSLSRTYKEDRQIKNDIFLQKSLEYIRACGLPQVVENHLTVRYHFFTLSAIKQIATSSLSKKEKKIALRNIFSNRIFRSTLKKSVLCCEDFNLRLFFISIKYRCYFISDILLKIKLSKRK